MEIVSASTVFLEVRLGRRGRLGCFYAFAVRDYIGVLGFTFRALNQLDSITGHLNKCVFDGIVFQTFFLKSILFLARIEAVMRYVKSSISFGS